MSAFLELVYEIIVHGVIAQPVIFVRWLLWGRKKSYKQYWEEADIESNGYLGFALIVAVVLIVHFVF